MQAQGIAPRRRRRARRTPPEVGTAAVVAAVRALDLPSAAEAAEALALAGGIAVSGRALRFLAEGAGALGVVGADGVRRYWMPVGAASLDAEVAVRDLRRALRREAMEGQLDAGSYAAEAQRRLRRLAAGTADLRAPAVAACARDHLGDVARLLGWPPP